jgi:hypothetical protein
MMFRLGAYVYLAFAALLTGCVPPTDHSAAGVDGPLVAEAEDAGLVAIASPRTASVRVIYARNGGMVLLGEVRVPASERVTGVALSADGEDLLIDTDRASYAVSTRTWSSRPARVVALDRTSTPAETAL